MARELDQASLKAAIILVRDRYNAEGCSDYDIGNGLCENFAHDVLEEFAGPGWVRAEWQDGRWGTMETMNVVDTGEGEWTDGFLKIRYPFAKPEQFRDAAERMIPFGANHVWIELNGRCYDCEHPDGVDSPFELKFFMRYLEREPDPAP